MSFSTVSSPSAATMTSPGATRNPSLSGRSWITRNSNTGGWNQSGLPQPSHEFLDGRRENIQQETCDQCQGQRPRNSVEVRSQGDLVIERCELLGEVETGPRRNYDFV